MTLDEHLMATMMHAHNICARRISILAQEPSLTRDEVALLIEWQREERAHAEDFRKKLTQGNP